MVVYPIATEKGQWRAAAGAATGGKERNSRKVVVQARAIAWGQFGYLEESATNNAA